MNILAIDTATNSGGAALSCDAEVIGLVMVKSSEHYSENILYCIDFLLRRHHLKLGRIDCFAAATGPGSFTGVRVGLATLKAFCQSLNKPAVGISTLEALAYRFRWAEGPIAVMIDARRGQIFGAVYRHESRGLKVELQPGIAYPWEWLPKLPLDDYLFVGDGARLHHRTIRSTHPKARVVETDNFLLRQLCGLAYRDLCKGQVLSAERICANYLRPSDAELQKPKR